MDSIVRKLRENRILQERADYSSKSTEELVGLAQSGDQLAVDTIINSYQDLISRMISRYFLSTGSGDKEDLRQVAMIGLWGAIQSYDSSRSGDFEAFAAMNIKGALTKEIDKDNAGKTQINTGSDSLDRVMRSSASATSPDTMDITLGDLTPDKSGSAEDQAIGNVVAEEIDKFMQSLKPNELSVIQMYIDGYKISKIAEELGMKYKTAEGTLARAKWKIKEFLEDHKLTDSKRVRRRVHEDVELSDAEKDIVRASLARINKAK